MSEPSFTTTISVDQTPEQAFSAISDVRRWWSGEIEGSANKLGDVFTYRYQDMHRSKQTLTEFVPNKKIVWEISDSYLAFAETKNEWDGTTIIFDVSRRGDKTDIRFTHRGLNADCECFSACSNAWGFYINSSLKDLIATGDGAPNPKEARQK
jgi:hypothetical protein